MRPIIRLLSISYLLVLSACVPTMTMPDAPTRVPTSQPTETSMPPTPQPEPTMMPVLSVTLKRGANMGNMLEAPNEGDWGLTVQEKYFDLIKEAGFDFVRLPVRWNTHAEEFAPYTIDSAFFARVDEIVGWAL